jgi:L-ascorbate metabolism protein UlaG (beta-lactamase superfamily)
MRITNLGHATLLVELGGVRLVTDPNFDARLAGLLPRVPTPGLAGAALAPPDAFLLTHAHADHLSFDSLHTLAAGEPVPLFAPPGVARWVARRGYPAARPLPPGEAVTVRGQAGTVTVRAGAAAHQGARYGIDRWAGRGSANTYLIDSGTESVFFAGDTGLGADTHTPLTQELGSNGRRLDVALLPIGRSPWWKPRFRRGHLSPGDALTLFERLDARLLIPYHWGTFHHLTSGPFDALREFEVHLGRHPRRSDVRIVPPGATFTIDP